jgi:hypothetical protein
MQMVHTGYLHFALTVGIELVGVGGFMGMTVLCFFGSRTATVRTCLLRHSWVTVCCAGRSEQRSAYWRWQAGPSPEWTLNESSSEF